jgi:hypothetical protein
MAANELLTRAEAESEWGFLEGQTLAFKNHRIRVIQTTDGTPWFALPDLCAALGFDKSAADVVHGSEFPNWARCLVMEDPNDEGRGQPKDIVVLSPVGVWWWTVLTDAPRGQAIAAWAKREALQFNPAAAPNNRHVYLTLRDGDKLPPYPMKYSGRKGEWIALKESDAYLFRSDPVWAERCRLRVERNEAEAAADPAVLEALKAAMLAEAQARIDDANHKRAARAA